MVWEVGLKMLGDIVLVIFGVVCGGKFDRIGGGGGGDRIVDGEGGQKKWYG